MNINQTLQWKKSSYCNTGACVEVALTADGALVRDSKNPHVAPLAFTTEEWSAFLQGVLANEFKK